MLPVPPPHLLLRLLTRRTTLEISLEWDRFFFCASHSKKKSIAASAVDIFSKPSLRYSSSSFSLFVCFCLVYDRMRTTWHIMNTICHTSTHCIFCFCLAHCCFRFKTFCIETKPGLKPSVRKGMYGPRGWDLTQSLTLTVGTGSPAFNGS